MNIRYPIYEGVYRILTYEIVFNLFHNELFLEVIKSILRCLKK